MSIQARNLRLPPAINISPLGMFHKIRNLMTNYQKYQQKNFRAKISDSTYISHHYGITLRIFFLFRYYSLQDEGTGHKAEGVTV